MEIKETYVRVFVLNQEEFIEILGNRNGEKVILRRYRAPLGKSAVDFLEFDYQIQMNKRLRDFSEFCRAIEEGKNVEYCWDKLMGRSQNAPENAHPYFCILSNRISEAYLKNHAPNMDAILKEMTRNFEIMQNDIAILFRTCFSKEMRERKTLGYCDALKEKSFSFAEAYNTQLEIVPLIEASKITLPEAWGSEQIEDFDAEVADVYYPKTELDLYGYLKKQYLLHYAKIRACKYCGKFFIADVDGGNEYCERKIEGSKKTCRQIGALRVYQKKAQAKPGMKLYSKAYKAFNARMHYGSVSEEMFQEWAKRARVERDRCINGEITEAQFEKWLAENH